MKSLLKAILSDIFNFFIKFCSYIFWNYKGVRITFSCQVSLKSKIAKGALFTGISVITENAHIGAFTYGHDVNINNATIGEYCSLAPGVKIGLDEHLLNEKSTHPYFYKKPIQKQTIIQDHVWIGANAVVLCGVEVGYQSVIAAGAVVNKTVGKYKIFGGVPAKEIGERTQI
jgi:acetyltransferase-like isoleucine patch superfamily enzyme